MDYQSNSNKEKKVRPSPENKVVEKVVTGKVIQKPPSLGSKFKATFFGGEFRGAMRYLAADVLLPAFRNLLVDATTKGVERVVYGESREYRRRPVDYGSRIQYNSPMLPRRSPDRPRLPDQPAYTRQIRRNTNDLVLASKEEANYVVERLLDIIETYDVASLADLYQLTGLPISPIDNKWGWTYLNQTEIKQVRDGYLIDLPPAEEI
jgi:hypothetical protein